MARRRYQGGGGKLEGNSFERTCEGKQRFVSEAGARAALKYFQQAKVLRTNDGMAVYQCRYCEGWHFGH